MDRKDIQERLMSIQDDICMGLEALDATAHFREDGWERPGGGGGRTRILEGKNIEKGGVNFSAVYGSLTPEASKSLNIEATDFFATGVSIVLHPQNPFVPIIHMNIRYFEAGNQWWFGGGIDVSPHYINIPEAAAFHARLKAVCDIYDEGFYSRFKKWADEYFYLKHRKESRGIGGIFFDRLTSPEVDKNSGLSFITDIGNAFLPAYRDFFMPNHQRDFKAHHKEWQLLRRGRYVEFNLVWDRGTRFGLETDGRTESILMSLPRDARWIYNYTPEPGSPEADTAALLKKDIDWISLKTSI